jgi:predicted DNA-binding transcriptional regulator YafY
MAGMKDIRKAGKNNEQVKIEYTDRRGKNITRTIRPYEVKGGYLWASDTAHGATRIHSFKVSRIKSATPTGKRFKPVWPGKL